MSDLISRQEAIEHLKKRLYETALNNCTEHPYYEEIADNRVDTWLNELPSAQPEKCTEKRTETHACDCISRQALLKQIDIDSDGEPGYYGDTWKFIDTIKNMPCAQPEPIRINLNEPIKVKLTDWGKKIYYHQYDRTNQIAGREICKPRFPREDENGYTEFQLWCFIELYGNHIGMTLPNVIEPLEIVYER